jgi:gluconokinase
MAQGSEKTLLMGVDMGTTNIKAALFDLKGHWVAQSVHAISEYSPQIGWSEMDPEEIWSCTKAAIRQCASRAPSLEDIRGIGFSSTKGCLLLLDEENRPLTPLITWRDERAHQLYRESGLDLYARTGVPASGDTLPKLMWFERHHPEVLRKARRALISQKDYLLHRILGRFVIDKSLAQTSMLFSLHSLDWDDQLLSLGGIQRGQLAELKDDTDVVGRLSASMASELGLATGTPVVIGGDDGCMSQVGLGAVFPGRIGANIGTGAALRAFTPQFVIDPTQTLDCKCLLPYGFVQTGITADAGRLLHWFSESFCQKHKGGLASRDPAGHDDDITRMAEEVPPGCQGLLFLPYFTLASSTVLKGPATSGVVFGLNYHHGPPHFIRAIMESIGFIYGHIAERMESLGLPVQEIVLGGGGSRSPAWRQIIAHILGRPVLKTAVEEASALGAAIMAAIGLGYFKDLEEGVSAMVKEQEGDRFYPDPSTHNRYRQIQTSFHEVHSCLESAPGTHQKV